MENKKNGITVVQDESKYGIYAWQLPNGKLFMDDDGNTLNIPAMKYDLEAIKEITNAAKYYGEPEGKAVFLAGVGRASESQAREDIDRMAEGLTPYGDISNWKEIFANERNS